MTKLLTLILILTALQSFSQNTIPITPNQALEAVRNKQRVESLSKDLRTAEIIIDGLDKAVENLQFDLGNKETMIELLNKNYNILQTQYDALKQNKDPKYSFNDFLKDAGKVFLGVVLGAVGILIL